MQAGPLSCFCNHITAARMRRIAFKKADYLERTLIGYTMLSEKEVYRWNSTL